MPSQKKALTMQREPEEVDGDVRLKWIPESAFSWLKNIFGEYATPKKLENMIREIAMDLPI